MSNYEIEDDLFEDGPHYICGTGVYIVNGDNFYDADIGGIDGYAVTSVELLHVNVGGLKIPRSDIAALITETQLQRVEENLAEKLNEQAAEAA